MKTNIKALKLVEKGLSSNTVSKLTESQINVLYSKLLGEASVTVSSKNPNAADIAKNMVAQDVDVTMTEKEIDEDADLDDSAEKLIKNNFVCCFIDSAWSIDIDNCTLFTNFIDKLLIKKTK